MKVHAGGSFQGFQLSHSSTPITALLRQSEPGLLAASPISLAQRPQELITVSYTD